MTDKPLSGRIALITGASRGIGAAIAEGYAAAGAHVVLLARSTRNLEKIDDRIRAAGGRATLIPFDLTQIAELEALGPILAGTFDRLDIFVANAGIMGKLTPVAHSAIREWQDAFTVNVLANVQMIRTLDPLLRASTAGRVIFTGSHLGADATAYYGSYAVSKAAMIHLAKTYAAECETTPIRCNVVFPGPVETAMLKAALPGGYHGDDLRQPADLIPLYLKLASEGCRANGEVFLPD